ncbi:MAG: hypothetical protein RQ966_18445 [Acetobacteraceae bacterium]|nr:hypothetical protein [Acetobacteraceae bacterium]
MDAPEMVSVLQGATDDGFAWVLRARFDAPDDLMTMLQVSRGDQWGEGGFGGPPLYDGERLNTWIGSRDGQPTFLALRADPDVTAVDIADRTGQMWHLVLSEIDQRFALRFGVFRVPDGAEVVEVRPSDAPSGSGQRIRSPWRRG